MVTDLSYYPPAASPRPPAAAGTPGPVLVEVAPAAAQHRAAVAFRVILAVPHLLALYVAGIGAAPVVAAGWLGALVTGRLPRFAAACLSGYLGWSCRVGAYLLLLTDAYPRFAFADPAYPVRVAVGPGKLSRLAVLFRVVLAIPAAVVMLLLASGAGAIVILAAWLTALVTGKLPGPLHQALAAVLRYAARYHGYLYLLTGAYPAGLFGDKPGVQAGAAPSGGAGSAAPTAEIPGPAGGQLVLSPGARRLVGLILVLGTLTVAGGGAWAGVAIHAARVRAYEIRQLDADVARHDGAVAKHNGAVAQHNGAVARHNGAVTREQAAVTQASNALNQVTAAKEALNSALDAAVKNINACDTLSCLDATSLPPAKAFAAFGRALRATSIPPGAATAARRLAADTTDNERNWTNMASSASLTDGENTATAAEPDGTRFDNDYPALTAALDQVTATLNDQAATLNDQAATLNDQGATLSAQAAALSRRAVTLNVPVSLAPVDDANDSL